MTDRMMTVVHEELGGGQRAAQSDVVVRIENFEQWRSPEADWVRPTWVRPTWVQEHDHSPHLG